MGFISDEFGTYSDYKTWRQGKIYEYHVKVTYDGSDEILFYNPGNITNTGIKYKRHDIYHGIFTSLTLNIQFDKKDGGGGTTLKTAYDTDGIKAIVDVDIYKFNPNTSDFDIWYNGKVDFNDGSYQDDIDEETISVKLIETGKQYLLLSRDETMINLKSLTSIGGTTITDFSSEPRDITYNPIDIYLRAETKSNFNFGYVGSANQNTDIGALGNEIYANQLDTRLNINLISRTLTPYTNSTGNSREIQTTLNGTYATTMQFTPSTSPNSATVTITFTIGAITIYTETISLSNIVGIENRTFSGNISDFRSSTIANGNSLSLKVNYLITLTSMNVAVDHQQIMDDLDIVELTDGADATDNETWLMHEALTRADQLLTDETTATQLIYSEFYGRTDSEFRTYVINGTGAYDGIISAWELRRFLDKGIYLTFRDLFLTCKNSRAVGMGYDKTNNRFYIEGLEEFYKDTQIIDFGVVDKLVITPDKNISKIKAGYNNKQKYKLNLGANEFNQKSEYSISLPVKEFLDIMIPLFGDSVSMEDCRKNDYLLNVTTDTDYDDNVYLIATDGSEAIQGDAYNASGIDGIDQFYNIVFSPRHNLIRLLPIIKGYLWKNTSEDINFLMNQKDVNFIYDTLSYYGREGEQYDIDLQYRDKPFFYPELYSFEAILTPDIVSQLDTDQYGYCKLTDSKNDDHYIYLSEIDCIDYDRKIKVKGKLANINR